MAYSTGQSLYEQYDTPLCVIYTRALRVQYSFSDLQTLHKNTVLVIRMIFIITAICMFIHVTWRVSRHTYNCSLHFAGLAFYTLYS